MSKLLEDFLNNRDENYGLECVPQLLMDGKDEILKLRQRIAELEAQVLDYRGQIKTYRELEAEHDQDARRYHLGRETGIISLTSELKIDAAMEEEK